MSTLHCLQLAMTDGIGPVLVQRMAELAGGAEAACGLSANELARVEGIGSVKAAAIHTSLQEAATLAPAELEKANALGASVVGFEDPAYPPLLKLISDPPVVLYIRGDLQPRDLNALAIVGSRRCSIYGREQSERIAALLAGAGFTVVSGGARGIDSASHRGAMSHANGRTIAVLGCGVDVCYPPENEALFRQIAQRGAIISEHALGAPPIAENFPRRNRIVSGIARGVLVVEAAARSGALITARLANEDHGRSVLALPGRIDNLLSEGPHQLIRDGATLVTNLEEIIDALGPLPDAVRELAAPEGRSDESFASAQGEPLGGSSVDAAGEASPDDAGGLFDAPPAPMAAGSMTSASIAARPAPAAPLSADDVLLQNLNDHQRRIMDQLDAAESEVDLIIERTGLDAQVVLRELTFLTLKGMVRRGTGQSFSRMR